MTVASTRSVRHTRRPAALASDTRPITSALWGSQAACATQPKELPSSGRYASLYFVAPAKIGIVSAMKASSFDESVFDDLRAQLADSDFNLALAELRRLIAGSSWSHGLGKLRGIQRELVVHQAAINRLEERDRLGLTRPEESERERSRLVHSLLLLIELIEQRLRATWKGGVPEMADKGRVARVRIFMSYRRSDTADVSGRVYDQLALRYGGAAVFKDTASIVGGDRFAAVIDEAIGRCTLSLIMIGTTWLQVTDASGARRIDSPRDLVRREATTSLERCRIVVPILVGEAQLPHRDELPPDLHPLLDRNALRVRSDPDFAADIERLIQSIESAIGRDG